MTVPKRTALITGCSDGGMGAELAKVLHHRGLHVYATARDTSKMASLSALGIETLSLDIQSQASIEACAKRIPSLDILVNNAGALMTMPVSDISIPRAKEIFDVMVWGNIAMTQAFLPHLIKSSRAVVVNHTSVGVHLAIPFQSVYNASKAAMSMFSDAMRLELEAFDIAVVNLKTGGVKTQIVSNVQAKEPKLPEGSLYAPAKEEMEKALRIEWLGDSGMPASQWAEQVAVELLKQKPPLTVWAGESASLMRVGSMVPMSWFDGMLKKLTGLGKIQDILRKR
jgi:1-acylglycerone phosphate reductase